MKKNINIILLVFLILVTISGCKSKEIDIDKVSSLQISTTNFIKYGTNFNDATDNPSNLTAIVELINQVLLENSTAEHEFSNDLKVTVNYSDQTSSQYHIDFDVENETVYLLNDKETLILDNNISKEFYNSEFFKTYMKQTYPIPSLSMKNDDSEILFNSIGQLNYSTYNGQTYTKEIKEDTSDQEITIQSDSHYTTFDFSISPTEIREKIYDDNKNLVNSYVLTSNQLIFPKEEGNYTIELTCNWDESTSYYFDATVTYTFNLFYDLPAEFSLSSEGGSPGELLFITTKNLSENEKLDVNVPFYQNEIYFYDIDNSKVGIIPIDGALSAGSHNITLTSIDTSSDEEIIKELPFEVLNRDYPIQNLTVSSSTSALYNDPKIALDTELKKTVRLVKNSSPVLLFTEDFTNPTDGIITTEYYHIRYTNGNPTPRRHNGVDIANALGTPILAVNAGKVVLSEDLVLTGNTVIVDHGCGLYSTYAHLDQSLVAVGDTVTNGQEIALMGTTGYSTGSHLHFEMYYDGNYIDPFAFIDKNPYLDLK